MLECARTRTHTDHLAANAIYEAKKDGPEIVDFRPVL
jgi:hypothetical protein